MSVLVRRYIGNHLAEVALTVLLALIVALVALLLLFPAKHHVGDTRYCAGTGTGVGSNGSVTVITVYVPCGVYQPGDPDVTK